MNVWGRWKSGCIDDSRMQQSFFFCRQKTSSHVVCRAVAPLPAMQWHYCHVACQSRLSHVDPKWRRDPNVSLILRHYRELDVLMAPLMRLNSPVGWPHMHAVRLHELIHVFTQTLFGRWVKYTHLGHDHSDILSIRWTNVHLGNKKVNQSTHFLNFFLKIYT